MMGTNWADMTSEQRAQNVARSRKWRAANPDYHRRYREANRERIAEVSHKRRAANPERYRELQRKSATGRKWRAFFLKYGDNVELLGDPLPCPAGSDIRGRFKQETTTMTDQPLALLPFGRNELLHMYRTLVAAGYVSGVNGDGHPINNDRVNLIEAVGHALHDLDAIHPVAVERVNRFVLASVSAYDALARATD